MNAPAELRDVTLDDKYSLERGRVFLTGIQALVRLADARSASATSPRGSTRPGSFPAIAARRSAGSTRRSSARRNSSTRTTSSSSPASTRTSRRRRSGAAQQVNLFPRAKYDGVFGIWYGKGPGVDRCGDVFRHANACGTAKYGGVIVCAGDDHAAKSSTLPHQTDHIFKAVMMPVLYPASVQEYLDLGVHGYAMSRYSGCWVAFKCVDRRRREFGFGLRRS